MNHGQTAGTSAGTRSGNIQTETLAALADVVPKQGIANSSSESALELL
jgi:hypothetical protein